MTTAVLRCAGGGVQIEEVDVATPRGKVLARRLTAAVPFDEGLLVTGPNGSGALPPSCWQIGPMCIWFLSS